MKVVECFKAARDIKVGELIRANDLVAGYVNLAPFAVPEDAQLFKAEAGWNIKNGFEYKNHLPSLKSMSHIHQVQAAGEGRSVFNQANLDNTIATSPRIVVGYVSLEGFSLHVNKHSFDPQRLEQHLVEMTHEELDNLVRLIKQRKAERKREMRNEALARIGSIQHEFRAEAAQAQERIARNEAIIESLDGKKKPTTKKRKRAR